MQIQKNMTSKQEWIAFIVYFKTGRAFFSPSGLSKELQLMRVGSVHIAWSYGGTDY